MLHNQQNYILFINPIHNRQFHCTRKYEHILNFEASQKIGKDYAFCYFPVLQPSATSQRHFPASQSSVT